MIEFLKENYAWAVPIIVALLGVIRGVFKLFSKSGKSRKQKFGDIKNSNIININGDFNNKRNISKK
jgi:hypothetical protein